MVDGQQHPVCCEAAPARTFRHKGLVERPGGGDEGCLVAFGCAGSVGLRRQRRSRVVTSRRCCRGVYTQSVHTIRVYVCIHTHARMYKFIVHTQAVHGQVITHAHTHTRCTWSSSHTQAAHGRHAGTRMHTCMHAYTHVRGRHTCIRAVQGLTHAYTLVHGRHIVPDLDTTATDPTLCLVVASLSSSTVDVSVSSLVRCLLFA